MGSRVRICPDLEPSKEDCSECETFESEPTKRSSAQFLGASEDGSKVFFTTSQPLLEGAAQNVYEYDFDAPAGRRVVRVTAGDPTVSDPGLDGVVQTSEDGSHVYFAPTVCWPVAPPLVIAWRQPPQIGNESKKKKKKKQMRGAICTSISAMPPIPMATSRSSPTCPIATTNIYGKPRLH